MIAAMANSGGVVMLILLSSAWVFGLLLAVSWALFPFIVWAKLDRIIKLLAQSK